MANLARFNMTRHADVTGTSGTGTVAEGVQFSDGTVVIRWRPQPATSTCVYGSVEELLKIHGHGGHTTVDWLDDARPSNDDPVPCPNGLHEPQERDEDGYAPYDGCPDCDQLANDNGLTHDEVGQAAQLVHDEGLGLNEAIAQVKGEANRWG